MFIPNILNSILCQGMCQAPRTQQGMVPALRGSLAGRQTGTQACQAPCKHTGREAGRSGQERLLEEGDCSPFCKVKVEKADVKGMEGITYAKSWGEQSILGANEATLRVRRALNPWVLNSCRSSGSPAVLAEATG